MTDAVDGHCGAAGDSFAAVLLAWFDAHGRKDLPWQHDPTPYRVWVSEIMLQQTQVATVIPYYQRFVDRFPDLPALARADFDEVMHLWSGLGYYARARNLHRAAIRVVTDFGGSLPVDIELLQTLPGIGRSTAGAILALADGRRHPILDGNVKRVLARLYAIEDWPGRPSVQQTLWRLAEQATPATRIRDYTQAIMDFGATLCTRARPACGRCPFTERCRARALDSVTAYPRPKPHLARPLRKLCLLLLTNEMGEVLMERRPHGGIWGGLWSLPEAPRDIADDAEAIGHWCEESLRCRVAGIERMPDRRHELSHRSLLLRPVTATVAGAVGVMEGARYVWYNFARPQPHGIAAPIQRLIRDLLASRENADEPSGPLRQAR